MNWQQTRRRLLVVTLCIGLVFGSVALVTAVPTASASSSPTLSAASTTVSGQPGGIANVRYNLSNVDAQSSVTLTLTNASSQVSVNKTVSDYDGGSVNPNGTEVVYFQPDSPSPTISYDIGANVSTGSTFNLTADLTNRSGTIDTITVTVEVEQNTTSSTPTTSPDSAVNLSSAVQQSGSTGNQATVEYTITNASGQSGLVVNLSNTPTQVSVNKTASDYGGGSVNPSGVEVTYFQPSDTVTATIAYDIAASARADASFNVSARVQNNSGVLDTTTAEIGNVQQGLDRFDRNGDGSISGTEVLSAIDAFENGQIGGTDVLQVIEAFEQGTVPSRS